MNNSIMVKSFLRLSFSPLLFLNFLFFLFSCNSENRTAPMLSKADRLEAIAKADTLSANQVYELAKSLSISDLDSFYVDLMFLKTDRFDAKAVREHLIFYKKLRKDEDYRQMLSAYFLGTADYIDNEMLEAEKSLEKSLSINEKLNDTYLIYNILNQLIQTKIALGDYSEAIEYCLEAIHTEQQNGNQQNVATLRLIIAPVYTILKSYDQSIEVAQLAAKGFHQIEDFMHEARSYTAIGQAYEQKIVMDSADLFYQKALTILETLDDPTAVAMNYGQYANMWIKTEDYPKALDAAKKANTWVKKGNYRLLDGSIEALLGNAFCKVGNTTEGLKHLHSALDFSIEHLQVHEISYLNKTLSMVYEGIGKDKLALNYFKKYRTIEDSLFTVSKQKNIDELTIKYETAEKEKALAEITHKAKTDRLYGIFGASMLLLLGGSLWFRQRAKNYELQQEQEIMIQNKKLADAEAEIVQQNLQKSQSSLKKSEEDNNSLSNLLALKNKLIEDFHLGQQEFDTSLPPKPIANTSLRILTKEQWQQFKAEFVAQHPKYLMNLKDKYPKLTSAETRMFLLIKLHFNSNEAADILGISKNSVYQNRIRLAKKLGLDGAGGLDDYVASFSRS